MWLKKQVNILPSKNGNSKIGLNPSALFNKPHLYYFNEGAVYHECQHLYITSDMEIKEGEWCFEVHNGPSLAPKNTPKFTDEHGNTWWLRKINMNCSANDPQAKKIIATTDTSLNLPQIPQQFIKKWIEEYNKGNVITEVMVEYNKKGIIQRGRGGKRTIIIRKIKESWSREEVIELCRSAHLHGEQGALNLHNQIFKQWIEENL